MANFAAGVLVGAFVVPAVLIVRAVAEYVRERFR